MQKHRDAERAESLRSISRLSCLGIKGHSIPWVRAYLCSRAIVAQISWYAPSFAFWLSLALIMLLKLG